MDQRCSDYAAGNARAVLVDNERGQRLLLADLTDDDAMRTAVYDELGDCADCYKGVTFFLAGAFASLINSGPNRDRAVQGVREKLAEVQRALE